MAGLDLVRPETVVIVMTHKARHANPDRVLGTGYDTIRTLGIVLETEHELGQHLRIHVRKLVRPDLTDHVPGRGGQAATVPDLKRRFE
ncbi:MAG: hypothetical protein IKX81_02610 [Firmicutes bacterium]|nr:hypothetical protein [Bacillota bacterium]